MSTKKSDTYITTPIFYVNDLPHIGHCYSDVVADVVGRFHALMGDCVRAQTGTDEHGQKVEQSATKNNEKPIEFCTKISKHFYELAIQLNFCSSYDEFDSKKNFSKHRDIIKIWNHYKGKNVHANNTLFNGDKNYIRTTEGRDLKTGEITPESRSNGRHVKAVIHFWERLEKNGWIYKDKYKGWYSVRDEAFYAEEELIEGKAPTGAEVVWHEEESYFFKLSAFQEVLTMIYSSYDIIVPSEKKREVVSFLTGVSYEDALGGKFKHNNLKDLCISRSSLEWGIPLDSDPKHKVYVWLDALINYLSALSFPEKEGLQYWNAAQKIHVIGKDILRFHAVYWPAFIIGYSIDSKAFKKMKFTKESFDLSALEVAIPNKILTHGWWTNKGEKISKSLGNVIIPKKEIEGIIENFGIGFEEAVDYFRYFLLSSINIGSDGDYDSSRIVEVVESNLCNNIGNLFNRTLSMIKKNCDLDEFFSKKGSYSEASRAFFKECCKNFESEDVNDLIKEFPHLVKGFNIMKIIKLASALSGRCNQFIEEVAPWKLKASSKEEFVGVMQVLFLNIVLVAQMLYAVMPTLISDFFDYICLDHDLRRVPTSDYYQIFEEIRSSAVDDSIIGILNVYKPREDLAKNTSIKSAEIPIFFKKSEKETIAKNS